MFLFKASFTQSDFFARQELRSNGDFTATANRRPFSLPIQPLTAFAILIYGKRDFAEAEGRKTEREERCMRRRRGGGRGKKFNAGPEGRNLAKETENQRGFA